MKSSIALLPLALGILGCGDPLVSPALVVNDRILGARVERGDMPEQSTVVPGQAARLRWFVASPDGPSAVAWAITFCAAKPVSRGLPRCDGPSFLHAASPQASDTEPSIDFTLPPAAALGGATAINANAAFCASGVPAFENPGNAFDGVSCPDADEAPLLATMPLFIETAQAKNRNPSFGGVGVRFDAAPWSSWTEPDTPSVECAGAAFDVPRVRLGTRQHVIELLFPENLSEVIPVVSTRSANRETIEVAHFVTGGDLERSFSTVDFSRMPYRASVLWDAPTHAPDKGKIVRFYFVVRDGRGGVDWTTHALCIVP